MRVPRVRLGRDALALLLTGVLAFVPATGHPPTHSARADHVGRIDRLRLVGEVVGPRETFPVVALNQYAVPVGGIGIFTPEWGVVDRAGTLCGSNEDRNAPCAADQAEVLVHEGVVVLAGPPVGGQIPNGDVVLTGREQGAVAVRSLQIGHRVDIRYSLVPASGFQPQFAIGGTPILVDTNPVAGLDDRYRVPAVPLV